jgi:hypothetical protein
VTAALLAPAALDAAEARARTDRLTLTLTDAHEQLIELFAGRAHEALGYGRGPAGWKAYCAAEFGELLYVRLPASVRAEAFRRMDAAGMSRRNIADAFRVSPSTVQADLVGPAPAAVAAGPLTGRVLALLAERGPLTVHDVARRLKVHHGRASGTLSRLAASGRIVYDRPARRGLTGTYRV